MEIWGEILQMSDRARYERIVELESETKQLKEKMLERADVIVNKNIEIGVLKEKVELSEKVRTKIQFMYNGAEKEILENKK